MDKINEKNEKTITVHPLTVLIDAVILAQKRGAFTLDEASLISQAVNHYKKKLEQNKFNLKKNDTK